MKEVPFYLLNLKYPGARTQQWTTIRRFIGPSNKTKQKNEKEVVNVIIRLGIQIIRDVTLSLSRSVVISVVTSSPSL